MWYRKARKAEAQALNVVGPAMPTPEMPSIPAPQSPEPPIQTPQDVPLGAEAPPPEAQIQPNLPSPPVHDRCHCTIKTLPGGRRIWEANANACPQCLQARDQFNAIQAQIFGV